MGNRIEQRIQDGEHLAIIADSFFESECLGSKLVLVFAMMDNDCIAIRIEQTFALTSGGFDETRRGRVEFSKVCKAVGIFNPKDSSELHGKSLFIGVNRGKITGYGSVEREMARLHHMAPVKGRG